MILNMLLLRFHDWQFKSLKGKRRFNRVYDYVINFILITKKENIKY